MDEQQFRKTIMVSFTHGLNVFKREEKDRMWVDDELDVRDFNLYYASFVEKQLFEYIINQEKHIDKLISENLKLSL